MKHVFGFVALALLVPACSLGEGEGEVSSEKLHVGGCWNGQFQLRPDFFAAVPYRRTLGIRVQHGGDLPNLLNNWDDLTKVSTYRGHTYGPYLLKVPRNHKRSNVYDGNKVEPPTPHGFVYDYRGNAGTGMIYATNGAGRKLRKW